MVSKALYYFRISTSSGVPIYRQIIDQVKTHIATEKITIGVFLPSVRQVGKALEINPMTVSKAYSLLEKEGVLEFVRGQGMCVAQSALPQKELEQRTEDIIPLIKEVIIKAKQLSLSPQKIKNLLDEHYKE